jgi:hypothetical protein
VVRHPTLLFWFEVAGSSVSAVLGGLTLMWPSWIELIFHVDPDRGSGLLEWFIVVISLMVSLCIAALARREWVRAIMSSPQTPEGAGPGSG